MTQTITTTHTPHRGSNANRGAPINQGYAPRDAFQEQGYDGSTHVVPEHQEYISRHNNISQTLRTAPPHDAKSRHQDYTSPNNNTPQPQGSASRDSSAFQTREYVPQHNTDFRAVKEEDPQRFSIAQPYRKGLSSNQRTNPYESPKQQDEGDRGLARQNSIPRKQLGMSASTIQPSVTTSPSPRTQTGQTRHQSIPKPLPSTPAAESPVHTNRLADSLSQPSSILNRSRPVPTSHMVPRDAQDVVDRAKTSSYDTTVVETVAPGQSRSEFLASN